ncbi:MAG TPA: hypothetical protein PK594_06180, partial [Mycobacterium sp.]|nr:hypothetical protein [Mycobacterium sp.]
MARRSDLDGVPGVAGVLTPAQCRQTAESIAALQLPSGETLEGRATGVDESGRLVVAGPEGDTAVGAGDVVHVRPARRS